jgi:hypothetical protein
VEIKMGVDTKGYINKEIDIREVFYVIVTKYDENAEIDFEAKDYSEDYKTETASIFFKDGEDQRRLFVYKELTGKEDTSLILGYWNNSIDIMANIVKCFGGRLLENDCSELEPINIPKDEKFTYSERVKQIETIIACLDKNLSYHHKIKMANQILKHKDQLKEVLIFLI